LTGINVGQGIGIELFITFVLVLCVYAPGTTPLAIGLSISTCHLFAVRLEEKQKSI
jgi:glycerol uptake facilitator-like aquaporin